MALYHVTRTDKSLPGELISAYIVAGGTRQARKIAARSAGLPEKRFHAERVNLTQHTYVLSTYWDETTTTEELAHTMVGDGHVPARFLDAPKADGDVTYSTI